MISWCAVRRRSSTHRAVSGHHWKRQALELPTLVQRLPFTVLTDSNVVAHTGHVILCTSLSVRLLYRLARCAPNWPEQVELALIEPKIELRACASRAFCVRLNAGVVSRSSRISMTRGAASTWCEAKIVASARARRAMVDLREVCRGATAKRRLFVNESLGSCIKSTGLGSEVEAGSSDGRRTADEALQIPFS